MEWKRANGGRKNDTLYDLETFLGGMETKMVRSLELAGASLETFLGGMETPQALRRDLPGQGLETFLGGMETPNPKSQPTDNIPP